MTRKFKLFAASRVINNSGTVKRVVLNDIQKNNDVLFGAQALNRRVPFFVDRLDTNDFDVLTNKNIKTRATQLERKLDRKFGGDVFFTKPALHPGTHKVMFVGSDLKARTEDDVGIADISKLKRGTKFSKVNGLNVITTEQIVKNRNKALALKSAAFRRDKDRKALGIIRAARRFKRGGII